MFYSMTIFWTPWFLKKTDIFSVKNIFSVWLQILFETDSDPLVFDIFNHIQGDRSASTKPSFLKISRQVKFDFRISKTLVQSSVEPGVSDWSPDKYESYNMMYIILLALSIEH